ncbi:MAG: site-specific integrase [Lachnospiraceae bacterium]|nr:site-specific integrase [Lachnospiraceae bacterium]
MVVDNSLICVTKKGYTQTDVTEINDLMSSLNTIKIECGSSQSEGVIIMLQDKLEEKLEQKIKEVHKNKLFHCNINGLNGRQDYWKTTNPNKKCHSKLELLQYLYNYYYGIHSFTIAQMYEKWYQAAENDMKKGILSVNTLKKYKSDYKRYVETHPISQKKMLDVKGSELFHFYKEVAAEYNMARTTLNNVKTLMNLLFDYAMQEHDMQVISARGIDTKKIICREISHTRYTDEERNTLLQTALQPKYWENVNVRAYLLDTQLNTRIGEIQALSWSDVDFENKTIYIHQEVIRTYDKELGKTVYMRVPHTKSKKSEGNRLLPLTDFALKILKYERTINPFGEYIFMYNGHCLTSNIINRTLKRMCEDAGIRYLSTHKARFWAISALINNGVDRAKVQQSSGHTTAEMTEYYRVISEQEEKKLAVDRETWNNIFNIKNA